MRDECRRLLRREVLIERAADTRRRERDRVVGEEARRDLGLGEDFELECRLERVGKADSSVDGEGAKYKVVELDARRGNDISKGVVSLREELGEVVEEDEEDSLSSNVERSSRVGELATTEEGSEESHERDELSEERSPALSIETRSATGDSRIERDAANSHHGLPSRAAWA